MLESFCPLAAIVADFAVGLIELLLDGFCPDAPGCPIMCVRLGPHCPHFIVCSYLISECHLNVLLLLMMMQVRLYQEPVV